MKKLTKIIALALCILMMASSLSSCVSVFGIVGSSLLDRLVPADFPVETEPVETEYVETDPVETEPVVTEPVETEHVHNISVQEKAATCTEEGYRGEVCVDCGEIISTQIYEILPHTTAEERKEATCKEKGYIKTYCTVCNTVLSNDPIAIVGHIAAAPATATEDSVCKFCGLVLDRARKPIHLDWKQIGSSKTYWAINAENNVLYIAGTGAIPDFEDKGAPWYDQRNKIRGVVIGEGITAIGANAFNSCAVMRVALLPNSLTAIGDHAFFCCTSLREIQIPANVNVIGTYAFAACDVLRTVKFLGNRLTELDSYVFYNCSSLRNLTIPSNVLIIGKFTFFGCACLPYNKAPSSVKQVGTSAFSGCNKASAVDMGGTAADNDYAALVESIDRRPADEFKK